MSMAPPKVDDSIEVPYYSDSHEPPIVDELFESTGEFENVELNARE